MNCYSISSPSNGQTCYDDQLGNVVYNGDDGTWEVLTGYSYGSNGAYYDTSNLPGNNTGSNSANNANNNPGAGFANIGSGIGSILNGLGGSNGIGDDIGNVLCAIKGNCAPKSITNVIGAQQNKTNYLPILMIGGVVVLLIFILKK